MARTFRRPGYCRRDELRCVAWGLIPSAAVCLRRAAERLTGPFSSTSSGALLSLNPDDDADRVADFFKRGRQQATSNG